MRIRESRRRKPLGGLIAIAIVAAVVMSGLIMTDQARADHIEIPNEPGNQFVWPVSSWIAANDDYVCCSHHSGSADLATQLFVPVRPARSGEVVSSTFGGGSYRVQILHEGDNGETYRTNYGHLVDTPSVSVGEQVGLDDVIGYLGRTGNANLSGPHIHFTIAKENSSGGFDPIRIPGLQIGSWAENGDYIPGQFDGLKPIATRPERTLDVRVIHDNLRVYETTGRSASERIAELSAGTEVTVLESDRGQYRIEVDGQLGWIAHTGTEPVDSTIFGVRVTTSGNANVRRGPSESFDVIGVAAGGAYLTGYEKGGTNGNWVRVMWPCNVNTNRSDDSADNGLALGGCPARGDGDPSYFKYGWMGPAVTDETSSFQARTRIEGLNVYPNTVVDGDNRPDCPCNSSKKIGEVSGIRRLVTVTDTWNGWYRVTNPNGPNGWIRGWFMAGTQ